MKMVQKTPEEVPTKFRSRLMARTLKRTQQQEVCGLSKYGETIYFVSILLLFALLMIVIIVILMLLMVKRKTPNQTNAISS
jgi:hypothetical protein